ncbi:uncharacterized protein G2W53_017800 [Senna tora]|uniref:Uncharacterized protein n=1 Tax=Senna tora TaxID=362788 RepID=A0A834TTV8_9FABA|nr:uncharacterized protein G2W53_017800 [Senna tora]
MEQPEVKPHAKVETVSDNNTWNKTVEPN